jgi:hypothetical protein
LFFPVFSVQRPVLFYPNISVQMGLFSGLFLYVFLLARLQRPVLFYQNISVQMGLFSSLFLSGFFLVRQLPVPL